MKTLTLYFIDTKEYIKLKANNKRLLGYKGFIEIVKVGDLVTYSDDRIWWRTGKVTKIEKSPNLKPLKNKGKLPLVHGVGKKI